MKTLSKSLGVAILAGACAMSLSLGGCSSKEESQSVADRQPIENSRAESVEKSVQPVAEAAEEVAEKIEGGVAQVEDVVAETAQAAQDAGEEVVNQVQEETQKVLDNVAKVKSEAASGAESHN